MRGCNSITIPFSLEHKNHNRAADNNRCPDYFMGLHRVAEEYHVCRVPCDDLEEVETRRSPCLVQLEGLDKEYHLNGPDQTTQEEQRDLSQSEIVAESVRADK